jgi:hypothetical protein
MAFSTLQVKLRMTLQQHLKLFDGGKVPSPEACDYQLVIHFSFGVFVTVVSCKGNLDLAIFGPERTVT